MRALLKICGSPGGDQFTYRVGSVAVLTSSPTFSSSTGFCQPKLWHSRRLGPVSRSVEKHAQPVAIRPDTHPLTNQAGRLRTVSSITRTAIRGAVYQFQPGHGYFLRRELATWHVDAWAHSQPGTRYNGLRSLDRD